MTDCGDFRFPHIFESYTKCEYMKSDFNIDLKSSILCKRDFLVDLEFVFDFLVYSFEIVHVHTIYNI